MLKRLTEEKLAEVLEVGIAEFAEKGLDGANVNMIGWGKCQYDSKKSGYKRRCTL